MDETQFRAILKVAVQTAVEQTQQSFESRISELTNRLSSLETPSRAVEYNEVTINRQVKCEETLDVVKSLSEFRGDQLSYVSWRQAAFAAHKIFEGYEGSSRYYQAIAMIRNKIVGRADSVLSSFNTVLNFKAIISRLDFTYADKRPIYLIEQEMSTLKQGSSSIVEFYDSVEKKLTLIINKTKMTHEGNNDLIASLNEKYRQDALRTFISGLRKPMCDILFSSRPVDMPSALALARELEANQTRYMFANSFSSYTDRPNKASFQQSYKHDSFHSPHTKRELEQNPKAQPMEIDPSTSRYRHSTQQNQIKPTQNPSNNGFNNNYANNRPQLKRPGPSDRYSRNKPFIKNNDSIQQPISKIQRVNNLVQNQPTQQDTFPYGQHNEDETYLDNETLSCNYERDEYDGLENMDEINFLEIGPSYRTYAEH